MGEITKMIRKKREACESHFGELVREYQRGNIIKKYSLKWEIKKWKNVGICQKLEGKQIVLEECKYY